MAKKPSTQASARATSGALELAKKKQTRLQRVMSKTKAGTDAGVESTYKWASAVKDTKDLERKQKKARFKVK